jgi:epoxide hydrolase-like predicted phosphatase
MVKFIIFDFGGAIIRHSATLIDEILQIMFPNDFERVEKLWLKHRVALNRGEITSDDLIRIFKENIKTNFTIAELKEKWVNLYRENATEVDWNLLGYIKKLKKNYPVYLFTDTIDVHDEYNKTRGIYEKFDKVFKSCEEGIAKFEGPTAFQYLLEKINAKPSECIYIDDLEKNVGIATRLGMKGIVYKDFEKLTEELNKQGVKV